MNKSIIAGIVALAIVLTCGIVEVCVITDGYGALREECTVLLAAAENETLSTEQYQLFAEHWHDLREKSELLLPHLDVYELNLRIFEASSYVEQGDFGSAHAQLTVVSELLSYVPHLVTPDFKHVF